MPKGEPSAPPRALLTLHLCNILLSLTEPGKGESPRGGGDSAGVKGNDITRVTLSRASTQQYVRVKPRREGKRTGEMRVPQRSRAKLCNSLMKKERAKDHHCPRPITPPPPPTPSHTPSPNRQAGAQAVQRAYEEDTGKRPPLQPPLPIAPPPPQALTPTPPSNRHDSAQAVQLAHEPYASETKGNKGRDTEEGSLAGSLPQWNTA